LICASKAASVAGQLIGRAVEHAPRDLPHDRTGLMRAFEVHLDALRVIGRQLRQEHAHDLLVDLLAHAAQREPAVEDERQDGGHHEGDQEPAGQRDRTHAGDHATGPTAADADSRFRRGDLSRPGYRCRRRCCCRCHRPQAA
jgi:hypothetical protein